MKTNKMRMLAILTALMMALSVLPAFAESAAAPDVASFFDSDQNIQMDIQVELNPALGSLIAGFTGAASPEGQNEASMAALNTVVQAINKLKTTLLVSKNAVSGIVGTEKGTLLDFQADVDEEGKKSYITSSLLPGLSLSPDPAMLAQLTAQSKKQMTPEQVMQIAGPYMAAFTTNFDKMKTGAETEEGAFVIEDFGTFNKRTNVTLTSHMVADLLGDLIQVFKKDDQLKKMLDASMQNNPAAALGSSMGEAPKSTEETLQEMEEDLKQLKEQEDNPVMLINAYEDGKDALYLDMVTPNDSDAPVKLDLLLKGQPMEVGGDMEIRMRMIGRTPQSAENPGEAVDWKAVEKDLQSGANYRDTLVNLTLTVKNDLPKSNSDMKLSMTASGMHIGITANGVSDLATKESHAVIGLAYMSPEPLVKLTMTTKPTEEEPVKPLLEGATNVVVSEEEPGEEVQNLLGASLEKALPLLIERLQTALPEEAPAFLALLEGASQDAPMPEPAPANP